MNAADDVSPARERRVEPARSETLNRAKASIARRIAGVCAHLPPGELDALVERMAKVQIKYEQRRSGEVATLETSGPSCELRTWDDGTDR